MHINTYLNWLRLTELALASTNMIGLHRLGELAPGISQTDINAHQQSYELAEVGTDGCAVVDACIKQ